MEEHRERRQDQKDFMLVLKEQNKLLADQNELLKQICKFITPVSAFFAALKNFVILMAWVVGFITAGIALWHWIWQWIVDSVKTH